MRPQYEKLKNLREIRLKKAKENRSSDWNMKHLEDALKKLKNGKAPDPQGYIAELIKPENIGNALKESLLHLMNKSKQQMNDPEFFQLANIVPIYKGKGERSMLKNDRGIFMLSLFRKLKNKLIHNDIYEIVDSNMSESQVGGRHKRGIRNHLFVLYSVMNSALNNEGPPLDLGVLDITTMFDALWLEECCNDLYEAGIVDDKMALIYEGNKRNLVAVSSPAGETKRVELNKIICQGESNGPLIAGVQMDGIGKDMVKHYSENLYTYKNKLKIPVLELSLIHI